MKRKPGIILILGVAVFLRLIFLWESYRQNPTFFYPIIDAYTYDKLAQAQIFGGGMGPESVWQPLFYPYFLSAFYFVFENISLPVRVFQVFLGLLATFLTYLLGNKLFSPPVGLLAAFLVAISGPLIFYEGELLAATWAVSWFLLSLLLFLDLGTVRSGGGRGAGEAEIPDRPWLNLRFLLLGLVCGVGIMIRPNITLFFIAAYAWLFLFRLRGTGWKKILLRSAATALGLAVILAPVAVRNHNLTGHWILLPVSGGLNFYIGNNPEAAETVATRPGERWHQLTILPREKGIFQEPYGSKYFYRRTFEYIGRRPLDFLAGLLKKGRLFFNAREVPRNVDIYLFRDYSRILRALVWKTGGFSFPLGIVLPFAFLGIVVNLRRFRRLAFLYIYLAAYSASIILFFVTSRYRLPLLPVLCIFGASGGWRLYRQFKTGSWGKVVLSLVLLAGAFIFCNRTIEIPEDNVNFESELYLVLGPVCLERGEIDRGIRYLELSAEIEPGNADAHNLLGAAYLEGGRTEQALAELLQAIGHDPEHAGAYKNLGRLQAKLGNDREAEKYFLRAAKYEPGDEKIHLSLAEIYENTGNDEKAARSYSTALLLKPDNIPVRRNLARVFGKLGKWETARQVIAEAVRHRPADALLRCDLGIVYGNSGRPEEAIAEFREALRLRPDFPVALLNLGIIYSRLGEKEKAEEQYRKLRSLDEELAGKLRNFINLI